MATHGFVMLETVEAKFNEILQSPEAFFKPQPEYTDRIKELSQKSYTIAVNDKNFKGRSLSKLFTDGFDEEQIWQQSDLLNNAATSNISEFVRSFKPKDILSAITKNLETKSTLTNRLENSFSQDNEKPDIENAGAFCSEESSAEEGYIFDDDSDSPTEIDSTKRINKLPHKKSTSGSVVDDKFFKLSKLENFLRVEDIKEERGDVESSDDEIDLFQDIPSDDIGDSDEESADDKTIKSSKNVMYDDFFDDPDSEIEDENDNDMSDPDENFVKDSAGYSFDENEPDEEKVIEKSEENNLDLEANVTSANKQKTAFELEQEKIKKQIQEYENSLLKPLPWHLTGEVAASSRPIDSLIYHETEFDSNTKQDLLVDKALTERIEEITIMAIRNKAFFDVERKYKPTEEAIHFKREVALEQTKSKKSLAEVYEEDYLKKQNKQEEEVENPKHVEIRKLMNSLFPQLHALFSYIPKPAIPEIKIISNLPAVTVEDVAPTSVSDATLLAPEEVKKKSGLVKGKTERTDTDRKRERRKKKVHQKLKEKKRLEKLESQKKNSSTKVSKLEKLQTLKKLKQHKNTKIASIDEGGKIKSSKDFFSRLQDKMDTRNNTENSSKKKKIK